MKKFMSPDAFAELLASANEALDHARGQRSLKSTWLPRLAEPMTSADVRRLRKTLRASQAVLALYLNVSAKLVQAWESGRRRPDGPALVLLRMMERQPGIADTLMAPPPTRSTTSKPRMAVAEHRPRVAANSSRISRRQKA